MVSSHVRPPLQSRSRRTLERLVAAGREIIDEGGVEAATVSAIVERAGSSVGSFYARFDGKSDFLRYLEERVWHVAREHWDAAVASESWAELSLHGVIRSILRLLVRIDREDRGTRRALGRSSRGPGSGGEAGGEALAFHRYLEGEVIRLLQERRGSIRHPRPELACRVAHGWMVGAVRELLSDPDVVPVDTVVEELTRAVAGYLGVPASSEVEGESVDFFDVWQ